MDFFSSLLRGPMGSELTERQREILDFIKEFIGRRGYPPALRDICARFGIKGPQNARKHLDALERKGFIRRSSNTSRSIVLGPLPRLTLSVPIAGRVRAGGPELAVEDITGHVELDSRFFKCAGSFLLRVEGDSMTGAGIDEGDLVLVRQQKDASDNDIVVAMLGDEATVKRFFRKGRSVVLRPENPRLKPIEVGEEGPGFSIIGKVISVIKRME